MNRAEKREMVALLKEKFEQTDNIYVVDSSELTVEVVNNIRRKCHENDIEMRVVKNTLAIKALEQIEDKEGLDELKEIFVGPSTVMLTKVANMPAKMIKELRKEFDKPVLKAAYIDSAMYVGDDMLDMLASLKSKEELIGDIILLLQSPAKTVISSLQSGSQTIAGLVKALQERSES